MIVCNATFNHLYVHTISIGAWILWDLMLIFELCMTFCSILFRCWELIQSWVHSSSLPVWSSWPSSSSMSLFLPYSCPSVRSDIILRCVPTVGALFVAFANCWCCFTVWNDHIVNSCYTRAHTHTPKSDLSLPHPITIHKQNSGASCKHKCIHIDPQLHLMSSEDFILGSLIKITEIIFCSNLLQKDTTEDDAVNI